MSLRARFTERIEEARLVHVDARVLAYHLVGREPLAGLSRLLLEGVRSGRVRAQTSAISLYQLLAEPYRRAEVEKADRAARYLSAFPGLEVVPVDVPVARRAAQVRARLGGRAERSLQIATGLHADADVFLTAGSDLRRIVGMEVVNLEAFVADGGEQAGEP
ncbi:MAG TPA: PIN domain-containing protein [Gemmatimonadota bacterium]|nr:PIN domain-containing protein [Gemmatimonadota bacterium]